MNCLSAKTVAIVVGLQIGRIPMEVEVLCIELCKTICSAAGLDGDRAVALHKRIQRHRFLDFLANLVSVVSTNGTV